MSQAVREKQLSLIESISLFIAYKRYLRAGKLRVLHSTSEVDMARRLQARIYLDRGNISSRQINNDGHIDYSTDPFGQISRYFGFVDSGSLVACCRVLYSDDRLELQIASEVDLSTLDANRRVCELSGFAKTKSASRLVAPTLFLYTLKYCFDRYDIVVGAVTEGPYRRFSYLCRPLYSELAPPFKIPHGNNIVHPIKIDKSILDQKSTPIRYRLLIGDFKDK